MEKGIKGGKGKAPLSPKKTLIIRIVREGRICRRIRITKCKSGIDSFLSFFKIRNVTTKNTCIHVKAHCSCNNTPLTILTSTRGREIRIGVTMILSNAQEEETTGIYMNKSSGNSAVCGGTPQ